MEEEDVDLEEEDADAIVRVVPTYKYLPCDEHPRLPATPTGDEPPNVDGDLSGRKTLGVPTLFAIARWELLLPLNVVASTRLHAPAHSLDVVLVIT